MLFAFFSLALCGLSRWRPDLDEHVVVDHADSFEVIRTVSRPKNVKLMDPSFNDVPIDFNDYPWPGHAWDPNNPNIPSKAIRQLIDEESYNITKKFSRNGMTQDELFRHPTAALQDRTTFEILDSIPAVEVRVTLNPFYGKTRMTNMYMPPGEVITIEYLDEEAIRDIWVITSPQKKDDYNSFFKRYRLQVMNVKLDRKVNHVGFPFGGPLTFQIEPKKPIERPIELIVRGCLKAPLYQYGITPEDEFIEEVETTKVPISMWDNGVIVQIFPTSWAHGHKRLDDAAFYWRSSYLHSQQFAPDLYNSQFGRPFQSNRWWVDDFVPFGEACAFYTANFNQYPPYWAPAVLDYDQLVNKGSWGPHHEMNHHHQNGWGWETTGEVTNNVVNAVTYSFQTRISSQRYTKLNGELVCPPLDFHNKKVVAYCCIVNTDLVEYHFQLLLQYFGIEKFQEYLQMCYDNKKYPEAQYYRFGKSILASLEVFKCNLLDFMEQYGVDDKTIRSELNRSNVDKYDEVFKLIDESPYKNVQFHPVTCFYAVGYERNGKKIETARPYEISPNRPTRLNFTKAMAYIEDDQNRFGKFEFASLKPTHPDRWVEVEKGVYDYIPNGNILEIDEYTVSYKDTSRKNEITTLLGKLRLTTYDDILQCKKYSGVTRFPDVVDAYRSTKNMNVTEEFEVKGITSPKIYENNYLTVTDASFLPTDSGTYIFGMMCDDHGAIYLSDKPLSGDADIDKDFLILKNNAYTTNANNGASSEPINLEAFKRYYVKFVIYNHGSPGEGSLKIKQSGSSKFDDFYPWFSIDGLTQQKLNDYEYKPPFIDIPELTVWRYDKYLANDPINLTVLDNPKGTMYRDSKNGQGKDCNDCNINTIFTDIDDTTEYRSNWWTGTIPPFPHNYDFKFDKKEKFLAVRIVGAGNQGYFPMYSSTEIRLSDKDEDLYKDESLIFKGIYDSKGDIMLKIGREVEGKYMRITFLDNSYKWKDGHAGRSCFSTIELISSIVYANIVSVPKRIKWKTIDRSGYHVNGRAFVGEKGCQYTIKVKGVSQFGFIGDKYVGMGSASIYMDDVKVATINEDSINRYDLKAFKFTSKSYMKILYISPNLTGTHTFKIAVESGTIRLTGLLSDVELNDIEEPNDGDDYNSATVIVDDNSTITVDSTATTTVDDSGNDSDSNKGGLSKTTIIIIGVVVAVVAIVAIVVGVVYFLKCKKNGTPNSLNEPETHINDGTEEINPFDLQI